MIYTCTLNPSIDYRMEFEQFSIGKLNRAKVVELLPGGKGLNVSILMNNLQIPSTLLGFIGGYTGMLLSDLLRQYDYFIPRFIMVKENTRINVKIGAEVETELNAKGPVILADECDLLIDEMKQMKAGDVFILSGSLPQMDHRVIDDVFQEIINKQALLVVDSRKEVLHTSLLYKPFLIKPNKVELEELFEVQLETLDTVITYARRLREIGAQHVLVSLGEEGAVLVTKDQLFYAKAPVGEVKNTVGAGDSMVAGFISKYLDTKNVKDAFRFSVACGSATAFSTHIALKNDIVEIEKRITIQELREDQNGNYTVTK